MHKESRSTRQGKQEVSTRDCSLNKARNERYDKDRMENIRLRGIGERSVAWKADGRKGWITTTSFVADSIMGARTARSNAINDAMHRPTSVVRHSHYKWSHLETRVCLCRHQSRTVVATSSKHLLQMYSTREVCEVERLCYPPPLRLFSLDLYYVKKLFIR